MMKSIIKIFERLSIKFKRYGEHHHATRNWVNTDCPSCSRNSRRYRLGWELPAGRVRCWQCGKRDAVNALCELANIDFSESLRLWKQVLNHTNYQPTEEPRTGKLVVPKGLDTPARQHWEYLERRGFDFDEVLNRWNIGGFTIHSRLPWRIYIPIHDRRGNQVSWTTRSISDDVKAKYITASVEEEALSHKRVLYGAHHALHCVIVVEGPLDAWAIGPGAVATCGISFTREQIDLLGQYPMRIVCFDSERMAQRRADHLCAQLSQFPGVTERIVLETGSDPASASKQEIAQIRSTFLQPEILQEI